MQRNHKLAQQVQDQGGSISRQTQMIRSAEEARCIAEEGRRSAEEARQSAEEVLDASRQREQELRAELARLKAARQSEIAVLVQRSSRTATSGTLSVSQIEISKSSRCPNIHRRRLRQ